MKSRNFYQELADRAHIEFRQYSHLFNGKTLSKILENDNFRETEILNVFKQHGEKLIPILMKCLFIKRGNDFGINYEVLHIIKSMGGNAIETLKKYLKEQIFELPLPFEDTYENLTIYTIKKYLGSEYLLFFLKEHRNCMDSFIVGRKSFRDPFDMIAHSILEGLEYEDPDTGFRIAAEIVYLMFVEFIESTPEEIVLELKEGIIDRKEFLHYYADMYLPDKIKLI